MHKLIAFSHEESTVPLEEKGIAHELEQAIAIVVWSI
jgi:hypothetical protein